MSPPNIPDADIPEVDAFRVFEFCRGPGDGLLLLNLDIMVRD
jgi:hypothetical protein